jgi:hypothetical protein
VEDLDWFLTEKWTVIGGMSRRSSRGWEITPSYKTHLFLKKKN